MARWAGALFTIRLNCVSLAQGSALMPSVLVRSLVVGIATAALGIPLLLFATLVGLGIITAAAHPESRPEVGWDLVSMAQNHPVPLFAIPLALFAVGFYFAYRRFSRPLVRK